MILVIDSNRFIAGLLKDSTSREIIFNRHFEFYSPDYIISEIKKYRGYLTRKTGQTDEQMDVILYTLLENINLIPYEEFEDEMEIAIETMKDIDRKDAPFLAVGMALGAEGIWTEDEHFHKQSILKVYVTKDLIDLL